MEQKERLTKVMVSMINFYQKGDEKACYREYFALNIDDRRLVEETFRQARSQYPTRSARWQAKGIYKLIQKNFKKEVSLMVDITEDMLRHWFLGRKNVFFDHYKALGCVEQETFLDGLKEVIALSDNEEFRQAAIDIPAYIQSQKVLP